MKNRIYIAILLLTAIVAATPFIDILPSHSYTVINVDATDSNFSFGEEEEPPMAAPNTEQVEGSVFWVILAFAALLFSVFVFMSYRRKVGAYGADDATGVFDDTDI